MRAIEIKTARQALVMVGAQQWLVESGSRLRLESCVPHRWVIGWRYVQSARFRREWMLLKYGHLLIRRFRRPR